MVKKSRFLLSMSLAVVLTTAALSYADSVCSVHDGDTFTTCDGIKVRLFGVDSPELKQPLGPQAKVQLVKLVESHDVTLDCKGRSYKRRVCQVWQGSHDIGAAMVLAGYAFDSPQYSHGLYQEQEQAAKAGHLGVWKLSDGGERPWNYRRNRYGKKTTHSVFK